MRPSFEIVQIINEKKLKYCRFIDTKQWQLFDQIMLPDLKWKIVNADGSRPEAAMDLNFSTREAWLGHFSELFIPLQAIHLIGPAEIEQVSPDEVKSISAVKFSVGPKGISAQNHTSGGGHYHSTWKRLGDDWFLSEVVLEQTYFVNIA